MSSTMEGRILMSYSADEQKDNRRMARHFQM